MKKKSIFGLLVILSMVLAACAGGGADGTPTGVSGGGDFGTASPLETEPVEEATEELPMATDAVVVPDATSVGTEVGTSIPATGGENDVNRLSNLMGMAVVDSAGNEVGEVNDFVMDVNDTAVEYVVVGAGGFLGIGEQNLLVPWNMLTVGTGANNENVLNFSGSEDALSNAPEADLNELDFSSDAWAQPYDDYWNSVGSGTGAGTAGTVVAATPLASATEPAGSNLNTGPVSYVLASKLMDANVLDESAQGTGVNSATAVAPGSDGLAPGSATAISGTPVAGDGMGVENLGNVEDVILDAQTGQVDYIVISPDASLNLGDVLIPVPVGEITFAYPQDNTGDNSVNVLLDSTRLQEAPSFEVDVFPDTSLSDWDADLVTYWGVSQ